MKIFLKISLCTLYVLTLYSCKQDDISSMHALTMSFDKESDRLVLEIQVSETEAEIKAFKYSGKNVKEAYESFMNDIGECYMKTIEKYMFSENLKGEDFKEIFSLLYNNSSFPLNVNAIHLSREQNLHAFANEILKEE